MLVRASPGGCHDSPTGTCTTCWGWPA
jgi:hypothetical protein